MAKQRRRFGKATQATTDPATGEVRGWTYRWDDGDGSKLAAADVPESLGSRREATAPGQEGRTEDDEP